MNEEKIDWSRPIRVWINCPSTLQPYHHIHGKRGIAVHHVGDDDKVITVCFTEGPIHSSRLQTLYLSKAE